MKRVLIVQSEMKHYRLPFFSGLYAALLEDGVRLTVVYSNSNPTHASRGDSADLPATFGRKVRGRWVVRRLLYQHIWKEIFASDLVVVGPEIKYLINPFLLVMSRLGLKRVAFWGLGPNRHPDRSPTAEWVKKHVFTCVDWWFAYTVSVARYLEEEGMPAERITVVQNATDTATLRRLMATISDEEVNGAREALTGTRDSVIGLYCGLVGEIKAIPLLLETARLVKRKCPQFHLVIIGTGPGRAWLESAISNVPWIHYLGSLYGRECALYYRMSNAFLLAGTAGLAVVDSFAAGLPLLATRLPTHPPEISYVRDGENGRLAPHEPSAFADSIVEVLSNQTLMEQMRQGARESGTAYTIAAMVDNFRTGIRNCLLHTRVHSLSEESACGLPKPTYNSAPAPPRSSGCRPSQ